MASAEVFAPILRKALEDYLRGTRSRLVEVNATKLSRVILRNPIDYGEGYSEASLKATCAWYLRKEYGTATPIFRSDLPEPKYRLTTWKVIPLEARV